MNYLKSALKQDQQSQLNQTLKSLKSNNFSHSRSSKFFYLDSEAFQSDDSRDDSKRITQIILKIYQKDKLLTQNSFNRIKNIVNEVLQNQTDIRALETLDQKISKMKETKGKDLRNYLIALSSKVQKEIKRLKKSSNSEINKTRKTKRQLNSLQQFLKNNTKFKASQTGKVTSNVKHIKKQRNNEAKILTRNLSFDESKLNASQNETPEQFSDSNDKNLSASKAAFHRLSSKQNSQSVSGSSSKQNSRLSSSDYSFDSLMLKSTPVKKRGEKSSNISVASNIHVQNQQKEESQIKDKGFIFFRPKVNRKNEKN